ncbi:hypothetical protein RRG08_040904 [Elysia crispata]|uniref:Uncharacterized protein n=1 Tax=Elysia crispata TaxID=231223 RepID=A0AAE1DKT2_9GAST|nr:hypothetical protein RRG08_040904 [Elysia crispata]
MRTKSFQVITSYRAWNSTTLRPCSDIPQTLQPTARSAALQPSKEWPGSILPHLPNEMLRISRSTDTACYTACYRKGYRNEASSSDPHNSLHPLPPAAPVPQYNLCYQPMPPFGILD